jgi:transcriptional regulator with XRE-family HTH domain
MSGIGKRIKDARLRKGFTQVELAKKVGASSHTIISDYERGNRGKKRPDPELLLKLCKVLDISIDHLFLGK